MLRCFRPETADTELIPNEKGPPRGNGEAGLIRDDTDEAALDPKESSVVTPL